MPFGLKSTKVANDHENGELRTNVKDLTPLSYVVKPGFVITH
jgi:hypothetical protein